MRKKTILSLALAFATLLHGGVPVRWTAETSRVQPVSLDAFRGDTLDLECTLKNYGQPVRLGAATASLMWQTNGMGAAWWQTNATVSAGGVVRATWSPSMDPGAATVAFFLPIQTADGANYRAAGAIRFRPSPGADSQIVALPQPGGTLDFGSYQLVNAPWATLEAANAAIEAAVTSATGALVIPPAVDLGPYATTGYVAGAITSATGAIVIPPPVDLGPYATTGQVAEVVQASENALAAQVYAVSNAAMQRAEMGAYATVQQVADAIAGIAIPSLDGYATQGWVADYVASNAPSVNLDGYATQAYADAAASNALAQAEAQIPSLDGYATQGWVADYVASNTPNPNLDGYATQAYADAAASNALAQAEAQIPSLDGYATVQQVADAVAGISLPSLDGYATTAYADAVAANAQAAAEAQIPSLDGYPTQQQMVDYVDDRMAQGVTVQVSTTRLETPDGLIWQDATGVVWQAEAIIGWYGEIWTNNAAYSPTSTGVTMAVTFAPAGPNAWTNALFGTITNVYFDGGAMMAWYTPAGVQHADSIAPLDSTNLTFNLLYPENWDALGTNVYASLSLLRGPIGISATNAIRQVAYTDGPGPDAPASGPADMLSDGTNTITAARDVYKVDELHELSGWSYTIDPPTGLTISDVRWEPYAEPDTYILYFNGGTDGGHGGPDYYVIGNENATELQYTGDFSDDEAPDGGWTVTFTRSVISTPVTNHVGRLALTNDVLSAASAMESTAQLRWRRDGTACAVTVAGDGTLSADTSTWTEGQCVLAVITLATGAGVADDIVLVGYDPWPRDQAFVACCFRIGNYVYVVPTVTL